jgi:energy-coupling factor transporter transmembrane protein EcfT
MMMKLHPLTHILCAAILMICTVTLSLPRGYIVLGILFAVALSIPGRTGFTMTGGFFRIVLLGAVFLFLIHGIQWVPFGISYKGIVTSLEGFLRIAAPVGGVIYLSKQIRSEELFALLVDLRTPPALILIIFRTLWLIPRLTDRMNEVVVAQKMRGMRVRTHMQRLRALFPTVNPIISSMIHEISVNSLTITAHGFLSPGPKSHITKLVFGTGDIIAIISTIVIAAGAAWLF